MQQNNITSLRYVGNVSLKIKVNDKIIEIRNHNKGLPALQRAFCNFLTGNDITKEDVPQSMDLRFSVKGEESFDPANSLLLNRLPITGKSWEEGRFIYQDESSESTYVAKLTAVLSSNSLTRQITSEDEANYDFRLYLVSGSNGTINGVISGFFDLAYLPISAEQLSLVGPGSQAIIEWSLQLLTEGVE